MSNANKHALEFYEILTEAIDDGTRGDYGLCTAIVEAFRESKGDEAAMRVRRVLWEMIQERA